MDFHEDTDQVDGANVYNGQNSTLWCNFREAFADEIQETYQKLRGDGLITYDMLEEQFIAKGSDKWSESVFNEDGEFKYVSMVKSDNDASNLPFARGDGEQHFKYFVENRLNYLDSKWYATDYANDYVSLRIYTPTDADGNPRTDLAIPASADITVTPYSNMYAGVRYKANGTLYQEKVEHGVPVTFEAPNETFNDTETAIYGASQLSSLGDLAPLYCGTVNVANATKLTEIKIGDATEGYANNNLKELSVGTNKLLKKIDIQNCPSFTSPLGLAGCQNIEEVYAKGSGITGVELADSGYLKIIQLPSTIANLTMKNQEYLEEFSMEGYGALKTMQVENCPVIDTLTILDNATNLERVRLTGVNWTYPDVSFLRELMDRNLAGIDENGANTDNMWIDGTCHIETLTGNEMAEINAMYPYLTITYDNLTADLIFMSEDGETELCRQTISNGGNGIDPTTNNTIGTPTKESTAQYDYTFSGWATTLGGEADANALLKVEADRYVYVTFTSTIRSYTVNFYTGSTLLETHIIEYGSDATYGGSTPTHESGEDYYEFTGWKPEPTNIQGNTNCYAQFYDTREIHDDWATIAANVDNCTATDLYAIGSYKPVEITYEDGTTETIEMEVIAHNHDELADGSFKWEKVGRMSYGLHNNRMVLYNGEIHVLSNYGGKHHYKWDGSTWVQVSTLGDFNVNNAIVYNDEIHVFHNKNHYKWDGTEWTFIGTYDVYGIAHLIAYNNELHSIIGNSSTRSFHYKWDGTSWTQLDNLPIGFLNSSVVVYNDEIHIIGGLNESNSQNHWKYNGSEWSEVGSVPFNMYASSACVYNNEIYVTKGNKCYKWDGNEWSYASTLPCDYGSNQPQLISYNNEIWMSSGYNYDYYKWSTKNWIKGEDLTKSIGNSCSGKMNGKICVMTNSTYYLVDGNEVTEMLEWKTCMFGTTNVRFSTYNNEIYACYTGGAVNDYKGKFYKYNGGSWYDGWDYVCDTPTGDEGIGGLNPMFIEYNGLLHSLGGYYRNNKSHCTFDGTSWTYIGKTPGTNTYACGATIYNNELHLIAKNEHYKYNNVEWTLVDTCPWDSSEVVENEKVCTSGDSIIVVTNSGLCYKWDGVDWTKIDMPVGFNARYAIVAEDKGQTHMFAGTSSYYYKNPRATLTFCAKNALATPRNIKLVATGTWGNTGLRTWLNNDLFTALPDDLQTALKDVSKYTLDADSMTAYDGLVNPRITDFTEKCWIPSLSEMGVTDNGIYADSQGECYPVFTDFNSRIKRDYTDTAVVYWLRSCREDGYIYWNVIAVNGGRTSAVTPSDSKSIVFGFCI